MEPIAFDQRSPERSDCFVVENTSWTMLYCWLGSRIYHSGVVRWHWQWHSVPVRIAWPVTHWLPAHVEQLPAVYHGNSGTDS